MASLRTRRLALSTVLVLFLAALVLGACGDEVDGEICQDASSAQECETCCEEAGYADWSWNAQYSPACSCIF